MEFVLSPVSPAAAPPSLRRGRRPDPIVLHPDPLWPSPEDPGDFHAALDLQMKRHGDTTYRMNKALAAAGLSIDPHAIAAWRTGAKTPGAYLQSAIGNEASVGARALRR